MDAPISITLAHLIIIWTLTLFLIAWMLISVILAFRSRHYNATKPDSVHMQGHERSGNLDTPRATIASQFSLYQATPAPDTTPHSEAPVTTASELPATPVI